MLIPIAGPCVIERPGDYYLAQDIHVTHRSQLIDQQAAIKVHQCAGRVSINLNGKRCIGAGLDPDTPSWGIMGLTTAGMLGNLVVYDGRVGGLEGFWCGIASDIPYTRIEQVDLSRNFYMGGNLTGAHPRLYYNMTDWIGGATGEAYAIGLNVAGVDAEIIGCTAHELYRQPGAPRHLRGEGVHIILNAQARNAEVRYCRGTNSHECADTIGIFAGEGAGAHRISDCVYVGYRQGIMGGGSPEGILEARRNIILARNRHPGSTGISNYFGVTEDNTVGNYAVAVLGETCTKGRNLIL